MPRVAPNDRHRKASLAQRISRIWLVYLRGQILCALGIGALTWIVGSGLGLPGALWLGLFAGLMETVPHIGPLIAAVPAVIVALAFGSSVITSIPNWSFALIIAGVYLAIQQVGSLIIQPKVLGRELDLPPLAVLVAVAAGAALAGIAGLYLAVPLLATAREIVLYVKERRRGAGSQQGDAASVAPPPDLE